MTLPWIQLAHAFCLKVSGRDARRYLHNRLSNDIRSLAPGEAIQAAALSAQGRVEGLFSVLCLDEESFVLISDGGDRTAIQAALGRFIVADRVMIGDMAPPSFVVHLGGDAASELREKLELIGAYVCSFPSRRISDRGMHIVLQQVAYSAACECLREYCGEPLDDNQYGCMRWLAGIPTYPEEVNQEVILTECGMLEAVSFQKGCYVGQEVIERSDAVGRLPRTLERILLKGLKPIARGANVNDSSGGTLGKVLSAVTASDRDEVYLFTLLRSGKYGRGDSVSCEGISGIIV